MSGSISLRVKFSKEAPGVFLAKQKETNPFPPRFGGKGRG